MALQFDVRIATPLFHFHYARSLRLPSTQTTPHCVALPDLRQVARLRLCWIFGETASALSDMLRGKTPYGTPVSRHRCGVRVCENGQFRHAAYSVAFVYNLIMCRRYDATFHFSRTYIS